MTKAVSVIKNENVSATKRQLWALFCATKKDYRSENLSREEASALLQKINNGNNTKTVTPKTKKNKLEESLIEYYKERLLPTVVASLKSACGIVSVVENDTSVMKEEKQYVMRGFGCSISYLTYDKRSKKAAEIETLFRKHHYTTFKDLALKEIEKIKGKHYLVQCEREGASVGAVFCQDFDVNSTLYHGVVNFMREQGVKRCDYITRLD